MTEMSKNIKIPLRVDFGGGWMDVPAHARDGAFIVNCTINVFVSQNDWPVHRKAGLGGSAAWAMLNGKDPVQSELDLGVGWQDGAVIAETGLCVWRSGPRPVLEMKINPDWLCPMALLWTGYDHDTPGLTDMSRNYDTIERAGHVARIGARSRDVDEIACAVDISYSAQRQEGMNKLPDHGEMAKKYCGGGWGGYALYLFENETDIPEDMMQVKGFIKEKL
jgi:hypothetical protein